MSSANETNTEDLQWVRSTEHVPSRFSTEGRNPQKALLDCCREEQPLNRFNPTVKNRSLTRSSFSGSALDRLKEEASTPPPAAPSGEATP